ncbi:putative bromodomain, Zinc finger, PHD-type, AAA+ ATPase domain, ATPase, AAA-type, core [Plasmopara halstedii]
MKRAQSKLIVEEDKHIETLQHVDENSESENDGTSENEEQEETDQVPGNVGRYHLRQRRQPPIDETSRTTRSQATRGCEVENTSRRYLLRDRSKTLRNDVEDETTASPETSAAYTDYHKRRNSIKRNTTTGSGSTRRLFFSDMNSTSPCRCRNRGRGRRNCHHRSLSLSSSSSSSSSSDIGDDDSDGGMRTSSPWRSSKSGRKSGSLRADITPVEVDRSITWDSVGGLKSHIEALKEMVMLPLLYPEFYSKYNVSPPSGVLFYGPPGTGKTLLARALANSCSFYSASEQETANLVHKGKRKERGRQKVTFYMRKGADCLSKWVGEAERQLRLLFEEARRNQPAIIFFDEIDGLAPVRSAKQDQIHASIVSTLLALMDGMDSRGRVVVIGATNRLDAIDPALRRPGRFDRELGFRLPNVTERKSMLAIHSKHWKPPLADHFLSELAEQTVGYCGADIKALCAEAALCSLRRVYPQVYASEDKLLINIEKVVVSRGDFVKAAKKITPASHRAVSTFASPLPHAVKKLLENQLTKTLREVARLFPLFPFGKQAIDDANTSRESDVEPTDDDDEDDLNIYTNAKHKDCSVCHGEGDELLYCDACPGAFHRACLSEMDTSTKVCENDESVLLFCLECRRPMPAALQRSKQRIRKERVRSIASLRLPRQAGFPRILVAGKVSMGQQYIGPALLHSLEGFTHFSLDYPLLVADSSSHSPEEALIQRLGEAQKCLPCVLYLPQIELWWINTSESMHLTLKMMLMNLQARVNLPVLFLACTTSACDANTLPEDLLALFKEDSSILFTSMVIEMSAPSSEARMAHFEQILSACATPPTIPKTKQTRDEKLEVLPLAPFPSPPSQIKLSPEEQKKRRERDFHFLRELRIFLGQVLHYCYSQKLYTPFYVPVDPVAVPNYYLIVKRPMDLSTIRDKLNDEEYTCFEQFMDDIQLIVRNANVFNPKRSRTRHIAHAAGTMKDNILSYAHRFRIRQGYDLFAKCREVTKRLRAHPLMYGEYGRRFIKVGKDTRKGQDQSYEAPHVRTSARLRGVKAPDISVEANNSGATANSVSNGMTLKDELSAKAKSEDNCRKGTDTSSAQQWFDDGDCENIRESKSHEEAIFTETSNGKIDSANDDFFIEGDRIFVSSRTHPGINREGGAGVVQSRNKDGSYNVKYILGGSEKSVSVKFIKRLTDDAVMQSVKTPRLATTDSTDVATSVRYIQDEEKMDETDYFDELLWPLLKEEGWKRDDNFDIIEASNEASGIAVQRVIFTPGKKRNGVTVTLYSVADALAYIADDPELSRKCFGTRYTERLMTDEALQEESSDEETDHASRPEETMEKEKALTMKEDDTELTAPTEDFQELPEFIYDEARMAAVLKLLVEKTEGWSVDKLRDELLVLNKLAYPFRHHFDRTELMTLMEAHVMKMQ